MHVTCMSQSAFERMVEEYTRTLARAYSKNSPSVARAVVADWYPPPAPSLQIKYIIHILPPILF